MKTYKVTGTQPVLDRKPGEEFRAAIPKDQETFLLDIKALKVVEEKRESPKRR